MNIINKTFFTHLSCSKCRSRYSPDVPINYCSQCNAPLLAMYDLESARMNLMRQMVTERENSLWRYRELLPVVGDANVISLGEGMTPLLRSIALGERFQLPHLFIKDEGGNPTGSFKARGIALAVSKAKELGVKEVCMPSAGNAGGALAAYAAKAGLKAHIFVPKDTPIINITEVKAYGAEVYLVDGVISDAAAAMNEQRKNNEWFDMSTMKEPYRLEGKKTMGYEIAEQFGWELPDAILYPTGGGTGLVGMWKAFQEMEQMGWISSKRPKMISVQSAGCAPVVEGFMEHASTCKFWNNARTSASGLRVPKPFADTMILQALYESNGTAIAVEDGEIVNEMKEVSTSEGILLCPEGAACIAALRKLVYQNYFKAEERIVIFNTGTGYKYFELLRSLYV